MANKGQPKQPKPVKLGVPGRETERKKKDKKSVRIHMTRLEHAILSRVCVEVGARPSELAKHALILYLEAYGRNLKEQKEKESQDGESETGSIPDGEAGTSEESGHLPEPEMGGD